MYDNLSHKRDQIIKTHWGCDEIRELRREAAMSKSKKARANSKMKLLKARASLLEQQMQKLGFSRKGRPSEE